VVCYHCKNTTDFVRVSFTPYCMDHFKNENRVYRTLGASERIMWVCPRCDNVVFDDFDISRFLKENQY